MPEFPLIISQSIPDSLYSSLEDELKDNWSLNNISFPGKPVAWTTFDKDSLIYFECATIIKYKIEKHIKNRLRLIRIHVNGQTAAQVTGFHKDFPEDNVWTAVFFFGPFWDLNWGGEFVCANPHNNTFHYAPYIPNTTCVIPSNWDHYGSSPNHMTDRLRITIAFSYCLSSDFYDMMEKYPGIKKYQ